MIKKIIFSLILIKALNAPECVLQEAIDQEKAILSEIQLLLKKGTPPPKPFCQWAEDKKIILKKSQTPKVVDLAMLLEALHTKDYKNISPTGALKVFTDAVKVHEPHFSLGWCEMGYAIAMGTKWWMSSTPESIE